MGRVGFSSEHPEAAIQAGLAGDTARRGLNDAPAGTGNHALAGETRLAELISYPCFSPQIVVSSLDAHTRPSSSSLPRAAHRMRDRSLAATVTRLKKAAICGVFALVLFFTASTRPATAQWTPGHPGDPRTCSFNRAAYCGDVAARAAFQAKYQRVKGRAFVGQLQCPQTVPLTYVCRWGSNVEGIHQTVVRFSHKAAGWKVAVGSIPAASGTLANDPTVCDVTRPTVAEKAHDCAQAAAKAAILAKHGSPQVNLVCEQAGTVYSWSCTATSGSYQVTFTKSATAWTTTVTP